MERLQVIEEFAGLAALLAAKIGELEKVKVLSKIEERILTECYLAVVGTKSMVESWKTP